MQPFIDTAEEFKVKLSHWYQNFKRSLPWRGTNDPYKIWLSEIILQQTRVQQGMNYYLTFIKHYPTVKDLANATEQEVLKDWQGLGYYSRARNLHAASKYIVNDLNGNFPDSFEEIKKLKGVGDYTAAAIASFAFQKPHAVVDGNVYRFLSRLFGINTAIDSTNGKKEFQQLANDLLNKNDPANHNQAIMEFGALQCISSNPNCEVCTFNEHCVAFNTNSIHNFPVKTKKLKQKIRYLNYLILENNTHIVVNLRKEKGIWQNLYDFPLIESSSEINPQQLEGFPFFKKHITPLQAVKLQSFSDSRKHILSHQILYARFFHFKASHLSRFKIADYKIIRKKELTNLPIPKLIENYLNEETNLLSLFD